MPCREMAEGGGSTGIGKVAKVAKVDPWDVPLKFKQDDDEEKWNLVRLKEEVLQTMGTMFDFLMANHLIASQRLCPDCKGDMKLITSSRASDLKIWSCKLTVKGEQRHYREKSLRFGTIFSKMQLKLPQWIILAYCWANHYSNQQTAHEASVSEQAVVDWFRVFTEIVTESIYFNMEKIGGSGKVVEVDESKCGKRKYNRGRVVDGSWVFGGCERGDKKIFMFTVEYRNEETLLPIIKAMIAPGSTIHSDCWGANKSLAANGYKHETVNHSEQFKDPITGAHTQTQSKATGIMQNVTCPNLVLRNSIWTNTWDLSYGEESMVMLIRLVN